MKNIFIIFIIASLISCGKYEEGPKFCLQSKTARLCRNWEVEKVFKENVDITSEHLERYKKHEMKFVDIGSLKETIGEIILAKAWEWTDKKESIIVTTYLPGDTFKHEFFIKRLTSKEFWYTTVIDDINHFFQWKYKKE